MDASEESASKAEGRGGDPEAGQASDDSTRKKRRFLVQPKTPAKDGGDGGEPEGGCLSRENNLDSSSEKQDPQGASDNHAKTEASERASLSDSDKTLEGGGLAEPATTHPALPWAAEEVALLQKALDAFFEKQNLAVRFIPIGSAFDPTDRRSQEQQAALEAVQLEQHRQALLARDEKESDGNLSAKADLEAFVEKEVKLRLEELRVRQLANLCLHLPSRVLENLSFYKSDSNQDRYLRNKALPLPLRPTSTATCLSDSALKDLEAVAERAAAAARKKGEDSSKAAEKAVISELAKKSFESFNKQPPEPHRTRLSEMAQALADSALSGFCGFWALVLTDKYKVEAQPSTVPSANSQASRKKPASSASASEKNKTERAGAVGASPAVAGESESGIKRFLVSGALVEVLANGERQMHAVWCSPNCSSRSTRLVLDAFLRAVVLKAFCFCEGKEGPADGAPWLATTPLVHQPLVFAESSDMFLWPRQCLFLLASESHLQWRQHAEVQASEDELQSLRLRCNWEAKKDLKGARQKALAEAKAFFRAKEHIHVHDPLAKDTPAAENGCACLALVEEAEKLHEDLTDPVPWKRNTFWALSANSFLLQLPRRQDRAALLERLAPQVAERLPVSWKETEGWIDAVDRLGAEASEGEAPATEVYEVLPLLPRLLDQEPDSLCKEELCGVPLIQALRLHKSFVDNFHA